MHPMAWRSWLVEIRTGSKRRGEFAPKLHGESQEDRMMSREERSRQLRDLEQTESGKLDIKQRYLEIVGQQPGAEPASGMFIETMIEKILDHEFPPTLDI